MKYDREMLFKREKYALEILKAYISTTSDGQAGTDGVTHLASTSFDFVGNSEERKLAIRNAIIFANEFLAEIEMQNKLDYVENI
jgi:hypothetical protein